MCISIPHHLTEYFYTITNKRHVFLLDRRIHLRIKAIMTVFFYNSCNITSIDLQCKQKNTDYHVVNRITHMRHSLDYRHWYKKER